MKQLLEVFQTSAKFFFSVFDYKTTFEMFQDILDKSTNAMQLLFVEQNVAS